MKIKTLILLLLSAQLAQASIDEDLRKYIETFKLSPVEKIEFHKAKLFEAGEKLFSDNALSGNRNISCKDCHHPLKGTSDGIALSLGQGSLNSDHNRVQGQGLLLRRHSPALYNLGHPEFKRMFWDGRVSFRNGAFQTPEPRLNGKNPKASHIVEVFESALDAQVIFPILSHDEMRGAPGTNEIADEEDNLKAWALVVERVRNERPEIFKDLEESFPGTKINIGHIARALAHFIGLEFQVWDTPYDRYLRGDDEALDERSKLGMKIFLTKGKCSMCHWGKHLTNHAFQSVGVPSLIADGLEHDKGRMELTGDSRHVYAFKNPGLRNVAKSAPYMHNGAFENLEQVIRHYDSIFESLNRYEPSAETLLPYKVKVSSPKDAVGEIYTTIFQPFLKRGLRLSDQEIRDLKHFLIHGLSESRKM